MSQNPANIANNFYFPENLRPVLRTSVKSFCERAHRIFLVLNFNIAQCICLLNFSSKCFFFVKRFSFFGDMDIFCSFPGGHDLKGVELLGEFFPAWNARVYEMIFLLRTKKKIYKLRTKLQTRSSEMIFLLRILISQSDCVFVSLKQHFRTG